MSAYKKLIKNSAIFAVANMGSKLISILLVPFYTYVLTTEQYGTIDMLTTTVSLLLPIITLTIYEATLRFALESKYSKKCVFSCSICVVFLGNILFLIVITLLKSILLESYFKLFYFVLFFQAINSTFSQFIRGIGKVKAFALNGVISTFIIVVSNIILLTKFNLGIDGYLISMILAYSICSIYLILVGKLWRYLGISYINLNIIKQMLIYSIPLLPNALMWWIINASDRYAITFILGVSMNGIYAVAYKIPTILNVVNNIFMQAWQLSAIEEGKRETKSQFYTNVFNIFSVVMLVSTSIILIFIKEFLPLIVAPSYQYVWRYIPFLLLSVVFSSFSSFLGTNYIAMRKTKGALKSSFLGASINIILNIILIQSIGLNGAAIATMISFFSMWIYRIVDTRKFVKIEMNLKKFILTLLIVFMQIGVLFINLDAINNIVIQFILMVCIICVNREIFIQIFSEIKNKIINN